MKSEAAKITAKLRRRGFDQSYVAFEGNPAVRCSQCEACVINGVPCHETGCPNAKLKSRGRIL